MPRKSITELTAQADATLPDNITGLITPAAVRNMIKDFLDCMRPSYMAVNLTTPLIKAATTVDSTFAWQAQYSLASPDWTVALATGLITRSEHSAMRITFGIDAIPAINVVATFTLYVDGVATPWAVANTSPGVGDIQSQAMSAVVYSGEITPTIQIRVKLSTNGNVTLQNGVLVCENIPVNVYT